MKRARTKILLHTSADYRGPVQTAHNQIIKFMTSSMWPFKNKNIRENLWKISEKATGIQY